MRYCHGLICLLWPSYLIHLVSRLDHCIEQCGTLRKRSLSSGRRSPRGSPEMFYTAAPYWLLLFLVYYQMMSLYMMDALCQELYAFSTMLGKGNELRSSGRTETTPADTHAFSPPSQNLECAASSVPSPRRVPPHPPTSAHLSEPIPTLRTKSYHTPELSHHSKNTVVHCFENSHTLVSQKYSVVP